jgi:cytochrome c
MKKLMIGAIATAAVSASLMAGTVNPAQCAGCHGAHFEKKALGVSNVVANMTHKEIEKALIGYKDGTYKKPNAGMAGIMKGQVAKYSDAELKAFSQTIGK